MRLKQNSGAWPNPCNEFSASEVMQCELNHYRRIRNEALGSNHVPRERSRKNTLHSGDCRLK
jgi:hypothetical protein